MKTSRVLFAALVLASTPTFAAPTTAPVNIPATAPLAPLAVPRIEARAVALMDESLAAYAALGQLSQTFTIASFIDGKAQLDGSGGGTLMVQKPGSARLEASIGEDKMLSVTDGATLVSQVKSTEYQQNDIKRNSIQSVIGSIPSSANLPLSLLIAGRNPLTDKAAPRWQSAQLSSKDGLQSVVLVGPASATRKPATIAFYLDPVTHLLARVEAAMEESGEQGKPNVVYSEITNFAPGESITPTTFQYVPAAGVKRIYLYDKNLVIGAKPFALTGKTLDDKAISLDDYKGRVVLLDFWATWCAPCRWELPNVVANYKKFHPQGFDVVGVSLDDEDSEQELRKFVAAADMTWPQLFDASPYEGPNAKTYGIEALPFALLIGKDGKIAAVNPRGEDLEPEILAALAR